MKARKNIFIISCSLMIFIGTASADIIKLKDGREINGRLKEVNEEDVVLDMGIGTIWFGKEEVESINNLSLEEAQARLSTEEAFVLKDKDKALSSSAKEGLNFISKIRKLEFKTTPEIETTNKDKIKEELKKNIEKYYSKEKLEAKRKLLVKLGLISDVEDYSKKVLELLSEEISGYYNTDDKKIYITESALYEILPGLPSISIMHEQVHALQDQHFNLKNITESLLSENEDKGLAIQSVIEGEATVLMFDAFLRSFGQDTSKKSFDIRSFVIDSMLAFSKRFTTNEGKPAIFMEDLLFPYVWGGTFIQHLVNTKGWDEVDAIYRDMPNSSEQIMHPEKYYIIRDEPKKINFPDLSVTLSNSWVRLTQDTLGEFSFYLMGKVFLDELSNKVMSEGWGGDYFEFYEEPNSKQTLFICISKWDSQRDADEAFEIYKKIIEKKYQNQTLIKDDTKYSQWKTEKENVYISKSEDSVLIIEGAPDNILSNLIAGLQFNETNKP